MAEDNANKSKKSLWIIIVCAGVVIIGVALAILLKDKPAPISESTQRTAELTQTTPSEQSPETQPSKESTAAVEKKESDQPVVDYGKLKEDKELQALMEKRKEKYGFEKGVDLIVKPDETVKVGDEVIPMKEILEKIRLERGEVIEKDITESTEPGRSMSKAIDEAVAAKKQIDQKEKQLIPSDKPPTEQDRTKEKKIEQIVSVYKEYKSTEEKITEKKELLAALETKKKRLETQKESLKAAQTLPAKISKADQKKPEEEKKPDTYIPIKPGKERTVPKPTKEPTLAALPKPSEEEKPDTYIPIKPGKERTIPKPTKEPTPAALPKPSVAPDPKADQTAPKPQIVQKDRKVTPPKEKKKVLESVSPQPVQETAEPKDSGGPIQKPVPSTKEMARIESYMKSIQDDINTLMLKKGDLESELKQLLTETDKPEAYGIYVVQRGDNIWDVHFAFLTEYFTSRGIELSRTADEPDAGGKSSGVGKILKFSENMVYIYNTRDRRLELDINMIHPLSKIVVFNMGQVFELLDRLAYRDIEKIEFDGENLWLPAES